MMIALQIEGTAAVRAAEELEKIPGLSVAVEVAEGGKTKDLLVTATAVATIVAAAGGVASLADQVLSWRDRWRKRHETGANATGGSPPVEKIILIVDGRRSPLDTVSPEALARLLRRLADPGE